MELHVGDTIRHFKGGLYRVDMLARCSETKKEMVVYTALVSGETWVRVKSEFGEFVNKDGYCGPRFTTVNEKESL